MRIRPTVLIALLLLVAGAFGLALPEARAADDGSVYLIEIKGEIDLGLAPYVRRALGEAEEQGAAAVVLEINTPGGRLDSALDIKNALLDSEVPTIAFINREAFSAGALIAIATHKIYMTEGSVIGAATPVVGDTGEKASEKIVSAVRKDFRATAEARGLDPDIAEAMVDESVAVPGVVAEGKLLTLTVSEALERGYAEARVRDLDALLEVEGLAAGSLVSTSPGVAERLVRFLTNPVVASLLMSLGFLGLFFELQSPGFGIGGAVGLALLALFFWGHFLAGLAGWEGIALVVVGVVLMALEMLVIPGFGIAGIAGIAAFVGGLFLSLVGQIPAEGDYLRALYIVAGSLLLMIVGAILSLRFLPKRSMGGLVLQEALPSALKGRQGRGPDLREVDQGVMHQEGAPQVARGARGTASTDLRPAGVATIEGRRVDVVTQGEYIAAGTAVEVVEDAGYRRVVRALGPSESRAGQPGVMSSEKQTDGE